MVARWYGNVDLTRVGSGRTGATNVLRTLGPRAAALVLLGDFLKGALAVLVAGWLAAGDPWAMTLAWFAAVVGHSYSPFLRFRGGRGVATGLGGLLPLAPAAAAIALLCGIGIIALTRYVSLGSIAGSLIAAVLVIGWALANDHPAAYVLFSALTAGFIIVAHRDNIQRLLRGTERRLGERVKLSGRETPPRG